MTDVGRVIVVGLLVGLAVLCGQVVWLARELPGRSWPAVFGVAALAALVGAACLLADTAGR